MKTVVLSQLLTLAAASAPTVAPRLGAEHLFAAVFALGLGCIVVTDYARRPARLTAVAAKRPARTEPLSLAA